MKVEDGFASRFRCPECGNTGGIDRKLAMRGAGLSKLLDIRAHTCRACGYTEVHNLGVIEGKEEGLSSSDILDLIFVRG